MRIRIWMAIGIWGIILAACEGASGGGDDDEPCAAAQEACNGVDDDCDGEIDEADAAGCATYHMDADADGFGVADDTQCLCAPSWTHQAAAAGDCDDTLPSVNPGLELDGCNPGLPRDEDCDGLIDEDAPSTCENADALGGPLPAEEPLWYPLESKDWGNGTTYAGHPHNAVDIPCPTGTPVFAAKDGHVDFVKTDCTDNTKPLFDDWSPHSTCGGGYGNNIIVVHPDGSVTRYAHLKKGTVLVSPGQFVCAGQQIGVSGASGRVKSGVGGNGAHLHFEYKPPNAPYAYPPDHFAAIDTYHGGNTFFDACADLDALHANEIISKGCGEIQQANECTLNRAVLAKILGDSVGVDETSMFGDCKAQCDDMNESDWYYDWMVAMTLLVHDDGVPAYSPAPQCQPAALPPRAHALKAIMEALDISTVSSDQQTPDLGAVPAELRPYANGAVAAGLLDKDEYVSPSRPLTYGWMARKLATALQVSSAEPISNDDMLPACPDEPQCGGPADCNDGQPCTEDLCASGGCQHMPASNGTPCGGGNTCQNGECVPPSQQCGNGVKGPGEVCDGGDLGGATCQSQGYSAGTLACNASCSGFNTSGCCNNECSVGTMTCMNGMLHTCGNHDPDVCAEFGNPQVCTGGKVCSGDTCACPSGSTGQFSVLDYVYPNFGPLGCSWDNTLKLKAAAAMISPTMLRIYVRKQDNTAFGAPGTLSLYVGSGPTCGTPPNIVKATKAIVVGAAEQTIDLTVNPYNGSWSLNETKTFWVGKDEGSYPSFRATGLVSIQRTCIP